MYDAKGSVSGDPGVGYFPGERSEPVFLGAAGENFADFKAEMAYFMAKWGTNVVYGENQSCQESRADHHCTFQFN